MNSTGPSSEKLANRILLGLAIGAVLGAVARWLVSWKPGWEEPIQTVAVEVLDPFGQIFLRLLFFVVVPLVFASLTLGVVQLGKLQKLGPLAGRTFLLFAANMIIGAALGLVLINMVRPGHQVEENTQQRLLAQFDQEVETFKSAAAEREAFGFDTVVEMFMPRNLLQAVVEFNILPLILFSLLLGAAGTGLLEERRLGLQAVLETVVQLMTRIVHYALLLAPFAVPALVFSAVVRFGLDLLQALLVFVAVVLGAMVLHFAGTLSLFLKIFTRHCPLEFFRAVRVVLVTAFSTSSSSATLPTSLQVAREKLKISPSTAGFVLPLGATMNMSGTALYEGCVVLFIAQVYGLGLGLGEQVLLLFLAVLSSVAVAGIPGGSLPLIMGLLMNFGIPPEGIAFVLGIDRLLDMSRTVVNVGADLVTAAIVDEGVVKESNPHQAVDRTPTEA